MIWVYDPKRLVRSPRPWWHGAPLGLALCLLIIPGALA